MPHRSGSRPWLVALALTHLALFTLACATARSNDFKAFSRLGAAYVDATSALLDEAAVVAIDADSALLASRHGVLSPEDRKEAALEHNELLRERVALLRDLQAHAALLRAYFVALGALAESDAATQIGSSAAHVAAAARKLGATLEGSSVGGKQVEGFLEPAVELAVAGFRRSALERELAARASSIDHELNLQAAALALVSETLQEDRALMLQLEETELVRKFAGSRLPSSWAKQRRELLVVQPDVKAAERAAAAAKEMRLAFQGLVEHRLDASDLDAMLSDLSQYVALVEAIAAARQ